MLNKKKIKKKNYFFSLHVNTCFSQSNSISIFNCHFLVLLLYIVRMCLHIYVVLIVEKRYYKTSLEQIFQNQFIFDMIYFVIYRSVYLLQLGLQKSL